MAFAVDRIDHVVLNCRDVEQTVDWYVRVLGAGADDVTLLPGSRRQPDRDRQLSGRLA